MGVCCVWPMLCERTEPKITHLRHFSWKFNYSDIYVTHRKLYDFNLRHWFLYVCAFCLLLFIQSVHIYRGAPSGSLSKRPASFCGEPSLSLSFCGFRHFQFNVRHCWPEWQHSTRALLLRFSVALYADAFVFQLFYSQATELINRSHCVYGLLLCWRQFGDVRFAAFRFERKVLIKILVVLLRKVEAE